MFFDMFSRHGRGSVTYEMHPGDPTDLEESASHPSPSTRGSAPSGHLATLATHT